MSSWLVFALLCAGLFVVGVVLARRDEKRRAEALVNASDWLLLAEAFDVVRSETPIHDALVIEMFAADLEAWDGGDVA